MDWYERAEDELVDSFNSGEISEAEFNQGMRDLAEEARCGAENAATEAYQNYLR